MPVLGRARASLGVFVVALVVALFSVGRNQQLGVMGGMTDEWYVLGANITVFGVLGIEHDPVVTRPPGYPLFIASSLRLLAGAPGRPTFDAYLVRGMHAVYLAQAVLLAAAAALLAWWLAGRVGVTLATILGLLFGLNPYTVVLIGLLHYDLLHILFLLASMIATDLALGAERRRTLALAGAGLLWGVTTLVRPLTLMLPPLLLLAFILHPKSGRRRAVRDLVPLALAMVLVIVPYTWRNHRVSGRWIPINAQGWVALWASTVQPLGFDPNHYYWDDLLDRHFFPVYRRVTGDPSYGYATYNRHQGALQDAFRAEALANLRERPGVYVRNVARSTWLMATGLNVIFVDVHREFQDPARMGTGWYFGADPRPYHPSILARATAGLFFVLTASAAFGLVQAVRRREPALLVPAAVALCVMGSHAITYVDVMYYYLRLPFLFVFAAYGLASLPGRWRVAGRELGAGDAIAAALAVIGAGLTLAMVFLRA